MSAPNMDVQNGLVEVAKDNLDADNRAEAVEKALFLACVVENADELLDIHEYEENVEAGQL